MTLWRAIFGEFRIEILDDLIKPDGRTQAGLQQKWGEISMEVSRWVQAWKSVNSVDKSIFNEDMVMDAEKEMFLGTSGYYFKFLLVMAAFEGFTEI